MEIPASAASRTKQAPVEGSQQTGPPRLVCAHWAAPQLPAAGGWPPPALTHDGGVEAVGGCGLEPSQQALLRDVAAVGLRICMGGGLGAGAPQFAWCRNATAVCDEVGRPAIQTHGAHVVHMLVQRALRQPYKYRLADTAPLPPVSTMILFSVVAGSPSMQSGWPRSWLAASSNPTCLVGHMRCT